MAGPQPDPAAGLVNRVLGLLQSGQVREARALCADGLARYPGSAELWYAQSELERAQRRPREAAEAARRAVGLAPRHPFLNAHLAWCLVHAGAFREAVGQAEAALQLGPTSTATFDLLGRTFAACDEQEKARGVFERELELEPGSLHARFNLATILRNLGDLVGAEAHYDAVIAARPDDWEAHKNRSDLRRQTPERNHVETLRALLAGPVPPDGEVQLRSALAKELEDLGDYPASFEQLSRANALRRSRMKYDVQRDCAILARIEKVYDRALLSAPAAGFATEEPIFVLGLPRTGSTLLERILGSHSEVTAAGELQNFGAELGRAAQPLMGPDVDAIAASARVDPTALGKAYLDGTRWKTGSTARFIDKLPMNCLHVGAIHRALPRARIVHIVRDPLDACYAIYKTLFKEGYPWSYSFEDLASYYGAYRTLMAHWDACLPGRIHVVRYEELVTDTERVVRGLLDYCGLGFEAGCLRYFERTDAVSTASAAQVRSPIYSSSIGWGARLHDELTPLRSRLAAMGLLSC